MSTSNKKTIDPIRKQYEKWDDQLYKEYEKLFPESEYTNNWDGVIFPEMYAKSRFKVMILNREGYGEPFNHYFLHRTIRKQIEADAWFLKYQKTLRLHLKQYLTVLNCITIRPDGFKSLSDDIVRERVNAAGYYDLTKLLEGVAYCNVKKSDGLPRSNRMNLKEYAEKGLDIIKKQIAYFNPSIILAGDVCDGILNDLIDDSGWDENLYIGPERRICIYQIKIDGHNYPLVDMFHPSRIQGMSEYYLELLHALQAVEKDNPLFWINRLDTPCFDM